MKIMEKEILDNDDNILNYYHFDNINGIIDIDRTISILLQSGVLINKIIIKEFGDMYDRKKRLCYNSVESFLKNSNDYQDIAISDCILMGSIDNVKLTCAILPKDNVLRIEYQKNAKLTNGLICDTYSDMIANTVSNNLRR